MVCVLQSLARSGDLYQVRLMSAAPGFSRQVAMASLPACQLAGARFSETWQLHTDGYGNIVAVEYGVDAAAAEDALMACTGDAKGLAVPASVRVMASARVVPSVYGERYG